MTGTAAAPGPVAAGAAGTRIGVRVRVRVPATSANLGPGFDSLGLALGIHDEVLVEAVPETGVEVAVHGQGAGGLPCDEQHLVVRAIRAGVEHAGATQPGLRLECRNAIPHGRGLGSSAAAVVAGLVAARGLLDDPAALDDVAVLALATRFEGHPDNAAAALLGGCTVSWLEAPMTGAGSALPAARAARVQLHPDLRAVVCVPTGQLSTAQARAMLPQQVPHVDAAFNAGRSALLVHALGHDPSLLLTATQDRLHQDQRADAMPQTAVLLQALRAAGVAAVVSGAGPSILALGSSESLAPAVGSVLAALGTQVSTATRGGDPGWMVLSPELDTFGTSMTTDSTQVL